MSKILHVTEAWKGGISKYVLNLIKAQIDAGDEVYLLSDEGSDSVCLEEVNVLRYKSSRKITKLFNVIKEVKLKVEKIRPNVIFTHSSFPGVYIRCSSYTYRPKIIHIPHSWGFNMKSISSLKKKVYELIESKLSERADAIVCMSKEEMRAALNIGIAANKLNLIYTGLPEKDAKSSELEVEVESLKNDESLTHIGFIGRLDYQKGIDILLKSIEMSNKNSLGYFFHVLGDEVRGNKIDERPENTRFYGWVEESFALEILETFDFLIVPSRWEGFSLVPLEAFRAKVPVIVSDVTSLHECVIDGFNGLIIDELTAEGIFKTLTRIKEYSRNSMSQAAYDVYSQCFNFKEYFNKIERLYK